MLCDARLKMDEMATPQATGGKALRSAARLLRAAVADDEPAAQTSCPYCRVRFLFVRLCLITAGAILRLNSLPSGRRRC